MPSQSASQSLHLSDTLDAWLGQIASSFESLEIVNEVVGGVLVLLFGWLAVRLLRWFVPFLNRGLTRLAATAGLRWFAIRAYRRQLRRRYGLVVNSFSDRKESLDLGGVFVPPTLMERSGGIADPAAVSDGALPYYSLSAVLTAVNSGRLLILGAPGSGKSTLLRALACGLADSLAPSLRHHLPIFVGLRDYAEQGSSLSLRDWIAGLLCTEFGLKPAVPLLDALDREYRLLILLDGLDEIGEADLAWLPARIVGLVDGLAMGDPDRVPGNQVLATCREQGLIRLSDPNLLPRNGFRLFRIAELRDGELDLMVTRRHRQFRERGKSCRRFLDKIRANPKVAELHRNPLLLSLSMNVYLSQADDRVPHELADFFERGLEHLVRRRELDRPPDLHPRTAKPYQLKLDLLHQFALDTLRKATREGRDFETWAVGDLKRTAEELAKIRIDFQPEDANALIREMQFDAGLIVDTNRGPFRFAHRTFHQFCAAQRLKLLGKEGLDEALANQDEPHWSLVLTFYAALNHQEAGTLVEQLLAHAGESTGWNGQRLTLVAQCAAVLPDQWIDLRSKVAQALAEALEQEQAKGFPDLLRGLIGLARYAPARLREITDCTLRSLFALDQPERLAEQIGRLDTPTAIELLGLMVDSGDPAHRRAALIGLCNLNGIERIPLVWRLLILLAEQREQPTLRLVIDLMRSLLTTRAAVLRLNEQPPPDPELLDPDAIGRAWPWVSVGPQVTNLARFLALAREHWRTEPIGALSGLLAARPVTVGERAPHEQTWRRLFELAVSVKDQEAESEWQGLPLASSRMLLRVQWRSLAYVVAWAAITLGAVLTAIALGEDPRLRSASLLLVPLVLMCGVALAWWVWQLAMCTLGWRAPMPNGLPTGLTLGMDLTGGPDVRRSVSRLQQLVRGVTKAVLTTLLLSPAVLLLPLALFLTHPSLVGHVGVVSSVAFSPNDRMLATGSWDATVRIWSTEHRTCVQRLDGHTGRVEDVSFSTDGGYVLTCSADRTARLWRADTGLEVQRFGGSPSPLRSAVLSPDGRRVLTGSGSVDGTVRIWDRATGTVIRQLQGHANPISSLAFSSDGRHVLTGALDNTARLWDPDSGRQLVRFAQATIGVNNAAFSPDSALVVTGTCGGQAWLWDTATGAVVRPLLGHRGWVSSVAFSPDGKRVVTGSFDHTADLWDVATGRELHELIGHTDNVTNVAFSGDGRWVATGSNDGTARLWDTESGRPLWTTPVPFYHPSTWDFWDLAVFAGLVMALGFVPTLKWFQGRYLYLRRPNRFIWVYDLPGIQHWISTGNP